jgi:hypothetical protein
MRVELIRHHAGTGRGMIKIVATICSLAAPDDCLEQMVTSSSFADISMVACMMGVPQLADWMKEHPGYRLAKWKCVMGTPAVRS